MAKNTTYHLALRAMVEGALMVALAEVLGYLKLWHMPEGGSVSLLALPIVFHALRWGLGHGLLAGLAFGILDFMLGGGFAIGWQSILGDYVIALTVLGLAGLGHKKGLPGVVFGSLLGGAARYVVVSITGATLWGEYMKDLYFFHFTSPWPYSFVYNLPALISALLAAGACVALYNISSTRKYLLGEDLK